MRNANQAMIGPQNYALGETLEEERREVLETIREELRQPLHGRAGIEACFYLLEALTIGVRDRRADRKAAAPARCGRRTARRYRLP